MLRLYELFEIKLTMLHCEKSQQHWLLVDFLGTPPSCNCKKNTFYRHGVQGRPLDQLLYKFSQNSQDNICHGVLFKVFLLAKNYNFTKKDCIMVFSCEFWKFFRITFSLCTSGDCFHKHENNVFFLIK